MTPEEILQNGIEKGLYTTIEPSAIREFAQAANITEGLSLVVPMLKIFGIAVTIILIGFYLWFFIKKSGETRRKLKNLVDMINPPEAAKDSIKARWEEIQRHFTSFREGEWKFAIIEADKLANDVLEEGGFKGDTIGEKLKNITRDQLQSINHLWSAHKLRNLIVHDSSFKVKYTEIRHALDQYKRALKELGVLD